MAQAVLCNYSKCRKDLSDEPERLALVVQDPSAVDPVIPANDAAAGQLDFCNADHAAKHFAEVHRQLPAARRDAAKRGVEEQKHALEEARHFAASFEHEDVLDEDGNKIGVRPTAAAVEAHERLVALRAARGTGPLGARTPQEDYHFQSAADRR